MEGRKRLGKFYSPGRRTAPVSRIPAIRLPGLGPGSFVRLITAKYNILKRTGGFPAQFYLKMYRESSIQPVNRYFSITRIQQEHLNIRLNLLPAQNPASAAAIHTSQVYYKNSSYCPQSRRYAFRSFEAPVIYGNFAFHRAMVSNGLVYGGMIYNSTVLNGRTSVSKILNGMVPTGRVLNSIVPGGMPAGGLIPDGPVSNGFVLKSPVSPINHFCMPAVQSRWESGADKPSGFRGGTPLPERTWGHGRVTGCGRIYDRGSTSGQLSMPDRRSMPDRPGMFVHGRVSYRGSIPAHTGVSHHGSISDHKSVFHLGSMSDHRGASHCGSVFGRGRMFGHGTMFDYRRVFHRGSIVDHGSAIDYGSTFDYGSISGQGMMSERETVFNRDERASWKNKYLQRITHRNYRLTDAGKGIARSAESLGQVQTTLSRPVQKTLPRSAQAALFRPVHVEFSRPAQFSPPGPAQDILSGSGQTGLALPAQKQEIYLPSRMDVAAAPLTGPSPMAGPAPVKVTEKKEVRVYREEAEVTAPKQVSPQVNPVDVNRIADQVYRVIERKIRIERERRGM